MDEEINFLTFDDGDLDIVLNDDVESGLNLLPGASQAMESDAFDGASKETDWEADGDHSKFLEYMNDKLGKIPAHKGNTTVGIERAIAYLRTCDKEISRAIQTDSKNVVDEEEAENLRDSINDMIDRLQDAHEQIVGKKRKKSASVKLGGKIYSHIGPDGGPEYYVKAEINDVESLLVMEMEEPTDQQVQAYMEWERTGLMKSASAHVYLMADPFLNEVTNIIIKSHVTYGRNIETVYQQMADKYKFSARDHLAVHGLLREKGLLLDRDFSTIGEDIELGNQQVGTKTYPT